MITTLHIKNIGIIDEININLNEGFNVLTGETGAGKTLIIGSLQILSGGRFSKEMIRHGEKNSFVEMSLFLPNQGYEDDTVVVSREINIVGKNICKINGRLVSVMELKKFMSTIIDIHGQNDNQSILDVSTHINLVDKFSEKEMSKIKEEYRQYYEKYLMIKQELSSNYGDDKEKERKLDLLYYQLNEIEDANLKDGEEEELNDLRKIISASEKINNNLQEAEQEINNKIIDSMDIAIRSLEKIEEYGDKFKDILIRLKSSYYEIEECGRDVERELDNNTFDEEKLEEIEDRLQIIKTLKRKYGNTIKEIFEYKSNVKNEIFEIENLDEYIKKLKKDLKELEDKMYDLSKKLHEIRIRNSEKIINEINNDLIELEMKNAKIYIAVDFNENKEFNKNGLDKVEFLISTNVGEDAKPLVKIASGGEMSRIMLSIKNVLSEIDEIPVMIFDEIDTGISGVAANMTGEKIKKIARNHQVICVTHLASIAAKGDYNYYIYKEVENEKTKTRVIELDEEGVLREIARIASGKITEVSINHARELRTTKLKTS